MEERSKNYCPDCGTEMTEIYEKPALNLTCPKCGCKIATTRWEKIDLDETNYVISVSHIENPTIQQIKVVSKIIGENFITSKKVLEKGGTVFEGKAVDVKSIVKTLKDMHIECIISPEFPY